MNLLEDYFPTLFQFSMSYHIKYEIICYLLASQMTQNDLSSKSKETCTRYLFLVKKFTYEQNQNWMSIGDFLFLPSQLCDTHLESSLLPKRKTLFVKNSKELNLSYFFSNFSNRFLNPNYSIQFVLETSRNKLKKYSVSKIVLTLHCTVRISKLFSNFLQSLDLQSRISKVFLITRTISSHRTILQTKYH